MRTRNQKKSLESPIIINIILDGLLCLSNSEIIAELQCSTDSKSHNFQPKHIDAPLIDICSYFDIAFSPLPDIYLPEAFLVSDHIFSLFSFWEATTYSVSAVFSHFSLQFVCTMAIGRT